MQETSRRSLFGGLGAAAFLAGPGHAQSSNWPTKPIRLVVPFTPAGATDLLARILADTAARSLGQPIIVENRPGGDSLIAVRAVAIDNDDHQFLFTPTGNFTPHPFRHEKLGYVRERDLLPIARFSNTILAVGVASSLGVKTLPEFIELARKRPNELNVMTVPGITDLVWDGFTKALDLKITKVPFTNLNQGAGEMATGRMQATMSSLAIMQPVVQANGARLIAVTSRERVPLIADVPTALEQGVPSLLLEGLVGMFGPRSLSPQLRKRIGDEVAEIARQPDIAERLRSSGQVPNPGGADEFSADIIAQEKQVAEIARLIGLSRKE